MDESLELMLGVVGRRERSLTRLSRLLEDKRSRLLATRLRAFKRQLLRIDMLINPSVEGDATLFTERQVASLNKNYLTKIHDSLSSNLAKLTVALTNIMDVVFDVNPVVETETELTTNLGKIYRTTVKQVEEMNKALSEIEGSMFPEDIMKATANFRKTWNDLKLLLTNQITEPLQTTLTELARENTLKKLSQTIYGGKRLG